MELKTLKTKAEWEWAFPVIKELRPHLDWDTFVDLTEKAKATDQYTLVGIEENGKCIAAMGFRIYYDYVRGKHLYVDDLVVSANERSRGLGAELLRFAERVAHDSDCNSLRLCAALENEGGRRFYEREGWTMRSVAYVKKTTPPNYVETPTAIA